MSDLREELFYNQKNGYDLIDAQEAVKVEDYCREYMVFLNDCRTERESVKRAVELAEARGFKEFSNNIEIKPGAKVYFNNRGKSLILAVIGRQPLESGCNITGSHVDCPRLDLKQNPLYESDELAFFKTHYYGGIKKYQWVTIPLELHGVVSLKNGENVDVVIGREPDEPRFVITDLLPHLAKDQMDKKANEVITGEGLNILIGSVPYADDESDRVKLAVLSILNDSYGIKEEDFLSAELCAVPAFDVSEIGIDRSLIGGYGHDDRVCAYAELKAILDTEKPEKTAVCIFSDKEETGSDGVTGMLSQAFETFMGDLCDMQKANMRHCFANSFCISADVDAAFDPNFPEVSEKRNNSKVNYGLGICKFTGARGKSGTSDANAETVATIRKLFDENKVIWQMSELGKVDQGGGGTIAMYMADRNIETIDAGVPVLSMHAPFEVVAKFDCYMAYKGFYSLYNS